MARATSIASHAPISPTAEMVPASHGPDARVPRSSPLTLVEFEQELEQRLRGDRRAVTLLASGSSRLHELASTLLETDGRALEMFADIETLVAYLRALIDEWLRRPPDKPGAPRRRAA